MRRAALIALLILAACGGEGETTTTEPIPALTTLAAVPPTTVGTPTTAATTTTTAAGPTTTLDPNADSAFALTQVVFGESSFVVITNWGDGAGTLDGYWLCQFPAYVSLPDIELAPGEQALIGLWSTPPPDLAGIAVSIDLGPVIGILDSQSGEVALYDSSSFDDPNSIVAYVEWGETGHPRSAVAIEAGIWLEGAAVEVFDDAPSISSGVYPAIGDNAWFADVGG